MSTTVELCRVKAELAALRARVEALAVEWERESREPGPAWSDVIGKFVAAQRLSRILATDADA